MMFSKLRESIDSRTAVEKLLLIRSGLVVVLLLGIFIAYKAWQEYQIYVVNQDIEFNPTAAGAGGEWVISWSDNSDNEDGYVVELRNNNDFELVATLAENETSYTESNLETGDTYCYRIGAFNDAGTSYSDEYCFYAEETDANIPQVASLLSIDMYDSRKIDVSNIKYYTSKGEQGNTDLSEGNVVKITYEGTSRERPGVYSFIDNGEVVLKGNTVFSWKEKNAVLIDLTSSSSQTVVASFFLRARAMGVDYAQIKLRINDDVQFIELDEGDIWFSIRVDIAYSGDTQIELRSVGSVAGDVDRGSSIRFGGITLE